MTRLLFGILLFMLIPLPLQAGEELPQRAVYDAAAGLQRIELLAGSYFFRPAQIVVVINVPVELTIRKEPGITPHTIVIHAPEGGIDFDESIGEQPKTIRFTPTRLGTFPFSCSKKLPFMASHADRGMRGNILVVDQ